MKTTKKKTVKKNPFVKVDLKSGYYIHVYRDGSVIIPEVCGRISQPT